MIGGMGAFSINLEQGEKTSGQLEISYSQMGFGETYIGDSLQVLAGQYKYLRFGCASSTMYCALPTFMPELSLAFNSKNLKTYAIFSILILASLSELNNMSDHTLELAHDITWGLRTLVT
jgi:hypothetical protein